MLLVLLAVEFASALGIERLPVLAGLVGPRNAETIALVVLGAVLLVAGLVVMRSRAAVLLLAITALVGAACSAPVVLGRGAANDPAAAARPGSLRVLSWNINGDLVAPDVIARLAARERADIVVLPEISAADTGHLYMPALTAAGLHVHAYPALTNRPVETVVLVRDDIGDYSPAVGRSTDPDRSAALTPVSVGLPHIVAIHAAQPSLRDNPQWRSDLSWVEQQCRDPNTIAVGDFNATLDNFRRGPPRRLLRQRCSAARRQRRDLADRPPRLGGHAARPRAHRKQLGHAQLHGPSH